ncbi:hypothetical protein [Enterococcus faecalis]|uniref:hypothetical protein n=1 Tax=Enterococcus faecalis TaxID=1351 RepID=UPI002FBE8AD1
MNNQLVFPSVRKETPTTKRKLILSFLLIGLFLFVSTLGLSTISFAAESDFSAEPMVPDNQIGETTGYFDLKEYCIRSLSKDIDITT